MYPSFLFLGSLSQPLRISPNKELWQKRDTLGIYMPQAAKEPSTFSSGFA